MSGSDVTVFREDRRKVVVDVAGRRVGFAFNPESGFVLVPEGVYKSEPEVVEGLREAGFVEGVFRHRCIQEL